MINKAMIKIMDNGPPRIEGLGHDVPGNLMKIRANVVNATIVIVFISIILLISILIRSV